jgi:probable addiction module antidote protein
MEQVRAEDLPDFDAAEFLADEDSIAAYLAQVAAENDPVALAEAMETVARARGLRQQGGAA